MRIPNEKDNHVYRLAYENYLLEIEDIDLIMEYVIEVLRCRFVMAEVILKEDANAWNRYCDNFNWTGIE